MSRTLLNFFLDTLLLIITLLVIWTTCVLWFVFPPATLADGWTLWGWNYNAWARLQFTLLAVIVLAILVHIMLHWNWVCAVLVTRFLGRRHKPDDPAQTLYGVGMLILVIFVIGGSVVVAQMSVRGPLK
jgi:hypothetical protein